MLLPNNQIKEFFSEWGELIISSLVVLICLVLFLEFPAEGVFQEICKELFFFLLVPVFYIKIVLKKSLKDFGFRLPRKKNDFFWAIAIFFILIIAGIFLSKISDFNKNYTIPYDFSENFWIFLLYELIFFNLLFLLQEIFFKGFILSLFSEKLKHWSVLIVFFIFCSALIAKNDFNWTSAPIILTTLFGSFLAYKNKSFWLSYLTGVIFVIFLDSFLIYLSK